MEEFVKVLGDRANQIDKKRDDVKAEAADLLDFSRKVRSPRQACG